MLILNVRKLKQYGSHLLTNHNIVSNGLELVIGAEKKSNLHIPGSSSVRTSRQPHSQFEDIQIQGAGSQVRDEHHNSA